MDAPAVITAAIAVGCLGSVLGSLVRDAARALESLTWPRWSAGLAAAILLAGGLVRAKPAPAVVPPPVVRLRQPAPEPVAQTPPSRDRGAVAARALSGSTRYTVVRGDSLWRIADRILAERTGARPTSPQIARFWPQIYAANRTLIGPDPNLILVGQQLTIPEG